MIFGTINVSLAPFALQCGLSLVLLAANTFGCPTEDGTPNATNRPKISLPELNKQLRHQSYADIKLHLWLMFTAASDGDDFYGTAQQVSDGCVAIAKASVKVLETAGTSADRGITKSRDKVAETIQAGKQPNKHPLELLCLEVDRQWETFGVRELKLIYERFKENALDTNAAAAAAAVPANRKYYFDSVLNFDTVSTNTYENIIFDMPAVVRLTLVELFEDPSMKQFGVSDTSYREIVEGILKSDRENRYRNMIELVLKGIMKNYLKYRAGIEYEDADDRKLSAILPAVMVKLKEVFEKDEQLRHALRKHFIT